MSDCCPYHNSMRKMMFQTRTLDHKVLFRRALFNESYRDCLMLLTANQRAKLVQGTMIGTLQRAWHTTKAAAKREQIDQLLKNMYFNGFE